MYFSKNKNYLIQLFICIYFSKKCDFRVEFEVQAARFHHITADMSGVVMVDGGERISDTRLEAAWNRIVFKGFRISQKVRHRPFHILVFMVKTLIMRIFMPNFVLYSKQ